MFAVPFQAYAAAAMSFCGPGQGDAVMAAASAAAAMHGDGHADHRHHHEAAAAQDAKQPAHDSADSAQAGADSLHKCGTCAACHATALTSTLELAVFQGLPRADLAEPAIAVATAVPRLLDKPPRA